jgi:hypothetical protein
MCLRLLYLIISRLFGWMRLSRRDESWKSAEILLLRHQFTVLQRQQSARPNTTWADRALIALLLEVIPKRRRSGVPLIVMPEIVLRWRRDIIRRRWAAKSRHKRPGRPATHRNISASVLRLAEENPSYVEPEVMWSSLREPSTSRCEPGDTSQDGCRGVHMTFGRSKVFEPLDDVLAGMPAALAVVNGNGRRAAFDRLAFRGHVDLRGEASRWPRTYVKLGRPRRHAALDASARLHIISDST